MKRKSALRFGMVVALAFGLNACGGGGNNNQGVVFNFLGFYTPTASSCADIGIAEVSAPLSSNVDDPFGGDIDLAIGLQNNLTGQAMRVDRLNYEYFIPGASVQPPSTVSAAPITLGPGPGDGSGNSSLPDGLASLGNCRVARVSVLPQQVRAWISLNRGQLPEAPFDMFLTMTAEGEATGGNRYTSNEQILVIAVVPDVAIPGTGPDDDGTDTIDEGVL